MSKCYSLLLFVLLLTSVVVGNSFVNLVGANPIVLPFIMIKSDGSVEPETRFITRNGSVYTLSYDIYREYAVILQCSNIIFDGAGHFIDGNNSVWLPYFNTGLSLEGVTNVTVKDLEVSGFAGPHISIENSSECVVLRVKAGRLLLENSSRCVIRRVEANNFEFYESNFNTMTESSVVGNGYVFMNQSNNNIITKNNITWLELSGNSNTFLENKFAPTKFGLRVNESNFWDNGSTGNHWSDYNGTDADGDGIGDTPYIINENNKDNYPIMNPVDISTIPEFPSWTILPLLGLATVVVMLYRKKLHKTHQQSY